MRMTDHMISVRKAWHDAFDPAIRTIDISDAINSFGVQYTAKGGDGSTMSHVEKAFVQQAIDRLRHSDPVAWAFGMIAYSPIKSANEKTVLHHHLHRVLIKFEGSERLDHALEARIMRLAFIAYNDVAHEDVTGHRKRRLYDDMAKSVGAKDAEEYEKEWHKYFVLFREFCKTLPGRALPPIGAAIWKKMDLMDSETRGEAIQAAHELCESSGIGRYYQ